ncbi:MAG: 2OG-Fe(II) oxygenase [Pseudomonadota bacterium]|nr:2OG-Fe(II) oxygenase [Pseudomonadota bacterium]
MSAKMEFAPPAGFAPTTHGVGRDETFFSLDAQAGRPVVLALIGRLSFAEAREKLLALQARAPEFAAVEADLAALVELDSPHAAEFPPSLAPDVRIVFSHADVFAAWGFAHTAPALAAVDRGGRVVNAAGEVSALLAALARQPREAPCDDLCPAPVLAIPDILEPELCRDLIAHFEAGRPQFGGMASIDAQGQYTHKIDVTKKHRFDLELGARDPFLSPVLAGILTRCLPEIKRAFQVDIQHTDRILLARYDETGGYFKRHRDNSAPSVAFRQFALSINLNDDFDGGHVLFPEYNARRYRPPAGAGVVFSCSLLHEAAAVTRGRRYCALTFLHDSAAQARWMAANRRAS